MEPEGVAEASPRWQNLARRLLTGGRVSTVAALLLSFATVGAIVLALGANPITTFRVIIESSFGDAFTFGQTVNVAALLVLTGLAATIPFSAHLWNVGGEGQLFVGAVAAFGVTQIVGGLSAVLLVIAVLVGGMLAGALWGLVPGVLKSTANANEVITSLMMSFVGVFVASIAIKELWPTGFGAQTERIPDQAMLPSIWPAADIDIGVLLAIAAALVAWALLTRTRTGFYIRAAALNPEAARANGIKVNRLPILTFAVGGAFAGLAGAIAVAGINDSLVQNFSQNYGFLGIAVALLARLNPLLVLPSAAFFGVLTVGSNGLAAETGLSSDVGQILGGVFVIMLVALHVIRLRYPESAST